MDDHLTDRQNNFDLLRIISAIAVVLIHANFHFFEGRYLHPELSSYFCIENLVNIITRFSVPIFGMMSGAFNLRNEKNGNLGYFYRKSLWKIGVPTITAILFFVLYDEIVAIFTGGSLIQPIIGAIRGFYALWFLYMLIGLYLITPLLVRLRNSISAKEYTVIGIVLLLWGVLSQAVSDYKLPYAIGIIGAFLGYYIIGDILLNFFTTKRKPIFYFLIALIMFSITWFIRFKGFTHYTYVTYRNFFSPTICLASIAIFLMFKQLKIQHNLSFLSGLTFYIYIFHTWILNLIFKAFDHFGIVVNELILIPIVVIITVFISGLISYFYNKFWTHQENLKEWIFSWKVWG